MTKVRCMKQGTQIQCTGTTQRDGMGREVGGISGWGTRVHPWLIHVDVWQKPVHYCKIISLQLKQINQQLKKKKKKTFHPIKPKEKLPLPALQDLQLTGCISQFATTYY